MKIIISPAKKMNRRDELPWRDIPAFMERAKELAAYVQGLSYGEAKELWRCNDKIAQLNFERFAHMNLEGDLTPAILSYEGIQYQYMAPQVMEEGALEYIQEHLRILSGFYGVLKPFDGIVPYRLEMQAKAAVKGKKDLYDFWGDSIYREVAGAEGTVILNLASKEYSKCVEKFLSPKDKLITVIFGERQGEKIVQKGTMAKMARGEMVRFMAENRLEDLRDIRRFDRLGYEFCEEESGEEEYVFLVRDNDPNTV